MFNTVVNGGDKGKLVLSVRVLQLQVGVNKFRQVIVYWIGINEFVIRNSSIHLYYSSAYPNAVYYDVFLTCLHVVE